jgi:hypothetical protein
MKDKKLESELRERMERAASRVLSEELGLEMDEDGKIDFEALSSQDLDASAPGIMFRLMGAFAREIGLNVQTDDVPPPSADSDASEKAEPLIEADALLPRFAAALPGLGITLQKRFSKRMNELFGIPLTEEGVIEESVLDGPGVPPEVARSLEQLLRPVSEKIEDFVQHLEKATNEEVVDTEADDGDEPDGEAKKAPSGRVLDLDEWRRRIEAKRGEFRLGETIQETLSHFFQDRIEVAGQGGHLNLNIDQTFFKEHGGDLMKQLITGIAEKIGAPKIELTLPMTKEKPVTPEPEETTDDSDAGGVKVSMSLDLASILGKLFKSQPSDDEAPG